MDALARAQPGFLGVDGARGPDGVGVTVSWWAGDDAAILLWAHPRMEWRGMLSLRALSRRAGVSYACRLKK